LSAQFALWVMQYWLHAQWWLLHDVEYVSLSHNLVSPYRGLPKKSRTLLDQAKGGLRVLGARWWRRRYNPL